MKIISLVTVVFFCVWGSLLKAKKRAKGSPSRAPRRAHFLKAGKPGSDGKADGSVWKIVEDKTAPGGPLVLAQTSKSPGSVFNICIAEKENTKTWLVRRFKPIAGASDQGGGLIWARARQQAQLLHRAHEPLEDNFWLYKVQGGKRISAGPRSMPGRSGKWHTMRVVMKGNKIECYLNGKS